MKEDIIPKIFISYSWDNGQFALDLATRLRHDGIDVVFDKWDLKPGQDKYAFMEKCVNDVDITKVLIILNKTYAQKANLRTGGVGEETQIISSEVYNNVNQEKFIPIISERDYITGEPYAPAYIKSKIFIDLSDDDTFDSEYEQLIRNIYEKPLYRKPPLGIRPKWLDNEKNDFYNLQVISKNILKSHNEKQINQLSIRFSDIYTDELKKYFIYNIDPEQAFFQFSAMKNIRDIFLGFIENLYNNSENFSTIICNIIENIYNKIIDAEYIGINFTNLSDDHFEIYRIHMWELFICIITLLLHYKDFKEINNILSNTFFLKRYYVDQGTIPCDYSKFYHYSGIIEEGYKPKTEFKKYYTLVGKMLCEERSLAPIYNAQSLANADIFLCQVYNSFKSQNNPYSCFPWFPLCYLYANIYNNMWSRLKSKKFCIKIFELFNVQSIDELKNELKKCQLDSPIRYPGSLDKVHNILEYINLDEIATIN